MNGDLFDDDPRDDGLAQGLRGLAPSEFELDADQTLGAMRPALRRARVRRRLAVSTSVLGVLVVVAAGGVVLKDQNSSSVKIQGPTQSTVSSPPKTPTSTAPRVSTTTTTTPRSTVTTAPDTRTTTTNGIVGPLPTTSTPRPTTPTSHDDHGGTTPTSTATKPPTTKTYSSTGGRVTVRLANGGLTLVSEAANAGYTAEVHKNTPADIEVRFSNGQGEWRIRVRVQDGQVRPEITQN